MGKVVRGGIGVFGLEMGFLGEICNKQQKFVKSCKISENTLRGAAKRLKR
jgi:hypothetical protein